MKKKALWKDIWIEIGKSKARFLALLAIITLGVAFFAGIKAAGPDMLDTANQYYEENNLSYCSNTLHGRTNSNGPNKNYRKH